MSYESQSIELVELAATCKFYSLFKIKRGTEGMKMRLENEIESNN